MSDYISRQAAISAICNACGKIDCDKMDKCEKLQLPPANCSEFPNSSDTISRQQAIEALDKRFDSIPMEQTSEILMLRKDLRNLPPAQPEQHIDADGTLWITVPDFKQVKRVIVDEEKSKFCRQFYMDAQPEQRTGKWERHYSRPNVYADLCWHCSACGYYHADNWTNKFKFCPNCGAKMEGVNE